MFITELLKEFKFNRFLLIFFIYSGIGAAIAAFILDHCWNSNRAPVPVMIYSDLTGFLQRKFSLMVLIQVIPKGRV